jgi:hypothetical protein
MKLTLAFQQRVVLVFCKLKRNLAREIALKFLEIPRQDPKFARGNLCSELQKQILAQLLSA